MDMDLIYFPVVTTLLRNGEVVGYRALSIGAYSLPTEIAYRGLERGLIHRHENGDADHSRKIEEGAYSTKEEAVAAAEQFEHHLSPVMVEIDLDLKTTRVL